MGFDPLRPFRYAFGFVGGTLNHGLNGMAFGGRNGMWVGLALGALFAISGGGIIVGLVGGAVMGLVGGAVLGGVFGAATGGFKGTGRAMRKEKYADDLAQRQDMKSARQARGAGANSGVDYRDQLRFSRRVGDFNYERAMQQENENERDYNRYWQDREDARRSHDPQHGRGW